MSILTLCVNINVHQNANITKKSMSAKTGMLRISSSGTLKTVCVQINLEKKVCQMQENEDGGMPIFITVARLNFTNKRN